MMAPVNRQKLFRLIKESVAFGYIDYLKLIVVASTINIEP